MSRIIQFWYQRYSVDVIQAIKRALPQSRLKPHKYKSPSSASKNTSEEKLIYATTEAQDTLMTATTVFPFLLFPDTIHLDREKLTIVHRSFFRTANTISIQIGDILSVKSNVGPFLGSLILHTKYFENSIQNINFLRRGDAIKFQKLIQGSLIAHRRELDNSNIEKDQLVTLLSDLGQGSTS